MIDMIYMMKVSINPNNINNEPLLHCNLLKNNEIKYTQEPRYLHEKQPILKRLFLFQKTLIKGTN